MSKQLNDIEKNRLSHKTDYDEMKIVFDYCLNNKAKSFYLCHTIAIWVGTLINPAINQSMWTHFSLPKEWKI